MSPAVRRAAIVGAGAAVLIVAFVALRGGSDTSGKTTAPAATPASPTIRVVDAKPQGGVQRLQFEQGGTVAFRVVSDTADEIHVHGYDVRQDVARGGSASFRFPARIDGRFEVELEGQGVQIAELEVAP